jgi:hypothetical protein
MRKKILVLDDMKHLSFLENFLSKLIVVVNNGLDGLIWFDNNIPDLLSAIFKCQIWTDMNFDKTSPTWFYKAYSLHYAVRKVRK